MKSNAQLGKAIEVSGLLPAPGAVLVAISTFLSANAQVLRTPEPTIQAAQSFALTDLNGLIVTGGKAETVEYQGRKAVRLTTQSNEDVFAFLKGIQIQDGTIEADVAMKVTTPPGVRMPGFIGIAFRARRDASHYELFYLGLGIPIPKIRRCGTTQCNTSLRQDSMGTSCAENGRGFTNPMRICNLKNGPK